MKDKGTVIIPQKVLKFEEVVINLNLRGESLKRAYLYTFPKARYGKPKGFWKKDNKGVWTDPETKLRLYVPKSGSDMGYRLM